MYTQFAYYTSPTDGNLYPVYVFIEGGAILPAYFIENGTNISLVYYPVVNGISANPILVNCLINEQGISNLVYYQPKMYGQNELRYCTALAAENLRLFCNPQLNHFESVIIQNNTVKKENHFLNRISSDLAPTSNIPVRMNTNIPEEILAGLQALQYGQLSHINISTDQYGFQLSAEDTEGNRILVEKHENNGISKKSVTKIDATDYKAERQIKVRQLRQEGRTQNEIANHLGVSQKTISNDLSEMGMR